MKEFLDQTGLATLWAKIKSLVSNAVSGKADKVASATNGNFAGLDSNGNLTDSGSKASDFKTKQTAVADPTASGNATSFIDSISQDANGEITASKKTIPNAAASTNGEGGTNGLMLATDKEKLAGIAAGATKVEASNTNGNIKIGNVETTVYTLPDTVVQTEGGKIPAAKLPSYVDDVVEAYPVSSATNLAAGWLSDTNGGSALTPEAGKIYLLMEDVTDNTDPQNPVVIYAANSQFRWSGTTYVPLTDGSGFSPITTAEIDTICV